MVIDPVCGMQVDAREQLEAVEALIDRLVQGEANVY